MLGLANAATPFGIKAIEELDKLNSRPGTATNAMVRFLAINTAGLAILPSGIIGVRAALGSADAAGIFFPTWFASGSATVVAVSAAILLGRLPRYRDSEPPPVTPSSDAGDAPHVEAALPKTLPVVPLRRWIGWGFWVVFAALAARNVAGRLGAETPLEIARNVTSFWILSAIIATGVLYGWVRGVRVYDSLVAGAKEGFQVAIRIIPYLVAILVAVGMFRASGGLELIVGVLSPVTALIGMPAEALPMAILRPLTGSGALGVAAEAMTANGPDSLVGYLVSTYQGSTETTFYVIAVYYGAIGVRNTRHTVPSCLMADVTGDPRGHVHRQSLLRIASRTGDTSTSSGRSRRPPSTGHARAAARHPSGHVRESRRAPRRNHRPAARPAGARSTRSRPPPPPPPRWRTRHAPSPSRQSGIPR